MATAQQFFEKLIADKATPATDRWNFRLQRADVLLAAKQYEQARDAYQRLAAEQGVPETVRGLATLAIGHTYWRQGNYQAASSAYREAAARHDIPLHHRQEAEQLCNEMQRLAAGRPRRDGTEGRTPIPELPEPGLILHVAPRGNDDGPGTADAPLATLRGARDRIRRLRMQAGKLPLGGVAILVHDGVYPVRDTWELDARDSGTTESPIVYRAADNASPVFSGGVQLHGFSPITDPAIRARLPEKVRDAVYCCDLKKNGVTDFGKITVRGYGHAADPVSPWVDVYVNRRPMVLARWPNDGFVEIGKVSQGAFRTPDTRKPGVFQYKDHRPESWHDVSDAWMYGYWGHLWAGSMIRIAKIDSTAHRITTAQSVNYGFREGYPYYYFNVLDEIDQPGEWYLDRRSGVLYMYPPSDAAGALVQFPVCAVPFIKLTGVAHVRIQGLTFELGRTDGLIVNDGSHVLLAGCTIRQFGGNGVAVHGGDHHGVVGCDILTVARGGCVSPVVISRRWCRAGTLSKTARCVISVESIVCTRRQCTWMGLAIELPIICSTIRRTMRCASRVMIRPSNSTKCTASFTSRMTRQASIFTATRVIAVTFSGTTTGTILAVGETSPARPVFALMTSSAAR